MLWSKLQKALYNIVDPDMKFQMQCSVFWSRSYWCSMKKRGREMIPRYWITISKQVVWDFPGMFMNHPAVANVHYADKADGSPFTVHDTYFWSDNYTWIADTLREYINTPKALLLTKFENDKYGLVDVLRSVDRRIGKNKREHYFTEMMLKASENQ